MIAATVTIRELFKQGRARLQAAGLADAAGEALTLLSAVLGWDRAQIFTWAGNKPTVEQTALFEQYIEQRAARWPTAYLTGHKEFMGLDLQVTPAVLIPRPETELLTELAAQKAGEIAAEGRAAARCPDIQAQLFSDKRQWQPELLLADVCTGSGAVALALAHLLPRAYIIGLDLSAEALKVACLNQSRLAECGQLRAEQLSWLQGDLLQPLRQATGLFTVITTNPPYLTAAEMQDLQPETVREPALALDGGVDGLALYPRLAAQAAVLLAPGGWLLCEIGWQQGRQAAAILQAAGFQAVTVEKDYGGRDRVVLGRKKIF